MSSCLKKRAYSTERSAREVAARRSAVTGKNLVAYPCEVGHFHIGNARRG